MHDELQRQKEHIRAEVPHPAADWEQFFRDALLLEGYARGEPRPAAEMHAAVTRIEAVVAGLHVGKLQEAEKSGVAAVWVVACRVRQRLRGSKQPSP
jgi:hypothetical protein